MSYSRAPNVRLSNFKFDLRPMIVGAALVVYWLLAVTSVANKSTTFDELAHVAAGYSYWSENDYRLQPENGNLPQRWVAMPLVALGYKFPELADNPSWHGSDVWGVGRKFFYESGNDADRLLLWSRGMMATVGLALGVLIYSIARRLFDVRVARVAVVLFAFCPTMLANGALATSDMAVTFFFTASVWRAWMLLHRVNLTNAVLSALATSGLFLAKFSAPLVIPMIGLLVLLRLASGAPLPIEWRGVTSHVRGRALLLGVIATIAVMHVVVAWALVWGSYGFRFDAMRDANPPGARLQFAWPALVEGTGFIGQTIATVRDLRLLPESYLYGYAFTFKLSQKRNAFLNGEFSIDGWPWFFPYCLLVKTPLTLFMLMGLGAAAVFMGWKALGVVADPKRPDSPAWAARVTTSVYRSAPLWSLFVVYWAFALTSHLNIGHRHIMPTFPVMLILAGAAARWLAHKAAPDVGARATNEPKPTSAAQKTSAAHKPGATHKTSATQQSSWPVHWLRVRRYPAMSLVVLACVGLFVTESLARRPNYLAYFNPLVGGPWYGYKHLVDSSLDWGQDLPALKQWLVDQGLDAPVEAGASTASAAASASTKPATEKVYLAYFGTALPQYYKINARFLPCFFDVEPPHMPTPIEPGLYCISATMLQNVYTLFPGKWNRAYEDFYRQTLNNLRVFDSTAGNPQARQQLVAQLGEAGWIQLFQQYEQARFARLCSFLRQQQPTAEINYSILVYRLDQSELTRATEGPPVELREAPPQK